MEQKKDELLGADLRSLLGKAAQYYALLDSSLQENKPIHFECFSPLIKKWLSVHAVPSDDGLYLWFRDLTAQKQETKAQAEGWRYHKSLTDNVPDVIMRFDPNLRCILANRSAHELLGIDPEKVLNKELGATGLPSDAVTRLTALLTRVFDTSGTFVDEFEIEIGERKRYFLWRAVPESTNSRLNSVLLIGQDITVQKEAEERRLMMEAQLRESQKMETVGTLSGGIAHDFNNLLAVILGNSELALDEVPQASPVAHNLESVRTAALRGRDLVKQILAFSKNAVQKRQSLLLTPLLRETAKLLRSTIPTTVDVRVDVTVDNDTVFADPVQMQQVLLNLVANGAQAMPDGGAITIGVRKETFTSNDELPEPGLNPGDYLALSVTDTGAGMDEATLSRVFDPFFTTKGPQGTGLGLAVVYGIVKSHEGAVTAESVPGKGSTFTVFLPLAGTANAEVAREEKEAKGQGRILFVDDEEMLIQTAKETLSRLGYDVWTATNPVKALEVFSRNGTFDLVITDQAMPGMSGLALVQKLLAIEPGVPIILCTGYSTAVSKEAAKKAGIREFFMKPYTRSELSQVVKRVLGTRKKGGDHGTG